MFARGFTPVRTTDGRVIGMTRAPAFTDGWRKFRAQLAEDHDLESEEAGGRPMAIVPDPKVAGYPVIDADTFDDEGNMATSVHVTEHRVVRMWLYGDDLADCSRPAGAIKMCRPGQVETIGFGMFHDHAEAIAMFEDPDSWEEMEIPF